MLQINTGKLFKRGVGRTNSLRGVLYSNLKLPYNSDIITNAGILRSTESGHHDDEILYEIEERIEESESGPGVLVSHTIKPYAQDFSTLASFALNAIVSPDRDLVTRLTNNQSGVASYKSADSFIRRCFDKKLYLTDGEAVEFSQFINKLLLLERRFFLRAMRAIKMYVTGIHRVSDDAALAYTLMVSAVESLAQNFDDYHSSWENFDERKKKAIDAALNSAPEDVALKIREAVISVEHPSLGRRYKEFVLQSIGPSYFRVGDALIGVPLAKYEVEEALRQAYKIRSRYVHDLEELPDGILLPHGHRETVEINRYPVLTLQGLSRLSRHAIKDFVESSPTVAHEEYDYTSEQYGVVSVPLAPQYWVWQPLVNTADASKRFEGFLNQYVELISRKENSVLTDLRPMLSDIENSISNAAKIHRPSMVILYLMFNCLVPPEHKMEGCEKFLNTYKDYLKNPSIELLIAHTLIDVEVNWSIEQYRSLYDDYLRRRSKPNGIHPPRLVDAAISLKLAETYRSLGNIDEAKYLVSLAVENYPGQEGLYNLESDFNEDSIIDWREILIPEEGNAQEEAL